MRLRALELDQFKKFDRPVRVGGIADGLNLVAGPNEMGKSTLLAGLQAALFERHRSTAQAIKDLEPVGITGAAPWVALEFDLAGGAHRIEKRFLRRPTASLTLPDGRRVEGDAAEETLHGLLGFEPSGKRRQATEGLGVWSVLWVGQGEALRQPEIGPGARLTLQSCLDAEFGEVLAGEHGPALLKAIETALDELVYKRGNPKGQYREVEDELASVAAEATDLARQKAELDDDFEQLDQAQREHHRLTAEHVASGDPAALAAARVERDALLTVAAEAQAAEAAITVARQELAEAERRENERHDLRQAVATGQDRLEEGIAQEVDAARQLAASEAAQAWQASEIERFRASHAEVQARARMLAGLHQALRQRDDGQAALEAHATEVRVILEPEALDRVRIAGRPPERARQVIALIEPLEIEIAGIGRLELRPRVTHAERWRREVADAERRVTDLLAQLGTIGPEAVTRPERAGQLDLFAARADDPPDLATVDGLLAAAERQADELAGTVEQARVELGRRAETRHRHEAALARARSEVEQDRERLDRVQGQLRAAEAEASDADLRVLAAAKRAALERASADLEQLSARRASLVEVDERIQRLEAAIEQRRGRLEALRARLQGLRRHIEALAGEGLDERLELAAHRREQLGRERAKYRRDVAVLQLLRTTLEDAERAAKGRYLAPVVERIRQHLQALFPDADLVVDDGFRVTTLRRGAAGEPLAQLSEGTREQVAILTRLAFAEMLADQGLPAVVVLDDALVFADDRRILKMFEILERAAEKLQIIVLTCREQLFAGLAARRLQIESVPDPDARRGAA